MYFCLPDSFVSSKGKTTSFKIVVTTVLHDLRTGFKIGGGDGPSTRTMQVFRKSTAIPFAVLPWLLSKNVATRSDKEAKFSSESLQIPVFINFFSLYNSNLKVLPSNVETEVQYLSRLKHPQKL